MQIDLKGKNILVTGGAGNGLGQGICEAVQLAGGRVILNDLEIEVAQKAAKKYENAFAVAGDISNVDDVKRMFEKVNKEVGTVHGIVNNAGIGLGKNAQDATEEEFDRLYEVDVKGIWIVSKAFVSQLMESNETGNIVNISSVQAYLSMHKMALYSGAKSAVNGITRGLAVELGHKNIRCNAIAPGLIVSEQTYKILGRMVDDPAAWIEEHKTDHQCLNFAATALDCGNVAVFLLCDLSRSITGQTIYVDNGTTNLLYNNEYTA